MAGSTQAFSPAGTVAIAASTTSARALLPTSGDALLVSNAASDYCFVQFGGDNTVVALGSPNPGTPVAAGQQLMLNCPSTVTWVAVILNSGTGTVFVTRGQGAGR